MNFLNTFKKRKILFLNIFLFLYIILNLLTGERGLMAYFEKSELEKKLIKTKAKLTEEIQIFDNKNSLLSTNLNFDFVDILIRDKLKLGKKEEIIIKIND
tara:strand:- start:1041 stop:1340 length:300 start_codon:yes stop_codon:yes gene_type:complete